MAWWLRQNCCLVWEANKGGWHPGYRTSNGHGPDHAEALTCHTNLDGRSSSICSSAHAYRCAQNHPGAGAFRSRSLWLLRPGRFCCCANRLYSFGRTNLAGLLRTACSVGGYLYGALWSKPLASSLNLVPVSGCPRPDHGRGPAHAFSRGYTCPQAISFPSTGFEINGDLLLGGTGSGPFNFTGQLFQIAAPYR